MEIVRLERKGVLKKFVVANLRNNHLDFTVPPAVHCIIDR